MRGKKPVKKVNVKLVPTSTGEFKMSENDFNTARESVLKKAQQWRENIGKNVESKPYISSLIGTMMFLLEQVDEVTQRSTVFALAAAYIPDDLKDTYDDEDAGDESAG